MTEPEVILPFFKIFYLKVQYLDINKGLPRFKRSLGDDTRQERITIKGSNN